jgi:hypothetical protein
MLHVHPHPLPNTSFLAEYARADAFTDCYTIDVGFTVSFAEFVEAFYTTRIFRLERLLLAALAFAPSTDSDAVDLANGSCDTFAVWKVEHRSISQILLRERSGRTRSWLMIESTDSVKAPSTRLYFGSALIPRLDRRTGEKRFGVLFTALLGFHRAYSRALLRAAARRLRARQHSTTA